MILCKNLTVGLIGGGAFRPVTLGQVEERTVRYLLTRKPLTKPFTEMVHDG